MASRLVPKKAHRVTEECRVVGRRKGNLALVTRKREEATAGHDVKLFDPVADDADLGMRVEVSDNPRKFIGAPRVVSIEKRNDFAACLGNSGVEGGRLAAVGFVDEPDARAGLRNEAPDDVARAVGRSVVHDDDFDFARRKVLREDALDGVGDVSLVVVGIDERSDTRCGQAASRTNGS